MTGVRVLTYCIMSNHFHLLLEVPHRDPEALAAISDGDLLQRLGAGYPAESVEEIAAELEWTRGITEEYYRAYRSKFEARMLDLSVYMREVKQRFTQWYNKRTGRKGPLWDDRFKSVLVEEREVTIGKGQSSNSKAGGRARQVEAAANFGFGALHAMAAYIDLNPVRVGIVEDPKDYRWSGYGEAVAGVATARGGLARMFGGRGAITESELVGQVWREVARRYRLLLFEQGSSVAAVDAKGRVKNRIPVGAAEAVSEAGGQLPAVAVLRCRVRYFSDGLAIGSEAFVERVFRRNRRKLGVSRKKGARRARDLDLGELRVMRDLRGAVS